MQVLESDVERKFVEILQTYGVPNVKLNIHGRRGWPDRMVILPKGQVAFVELKRKGEVTRPLQKHIHKKLKDLDHHVATFDNAIDAFEFVRSIYKHTPVKHG